jgi:hypothetical protein
MRYVFAAAFIIATVFTMVASAPSYAQLGSTAPEKTPLDLLYERQQKEREENEKAYNAQMKRLKAQGPTTTSSDPWKGVRSSTDSSGKR